MEETLGAENRYSLSIAPSGTNTKPIPLKEIPTELRATPTFPEMDRVLGGGLVTGSFVLVGGAPGIGKSTLLLQLAAKISGLQPVLYLSGEESEGQIKLRAQRLGLNAPNLLILHEINLETITQHIKTIQPSLVILDSIQTMYKNDVASAPGSVAQVRECAGELLRWCKNLGTTMIIVGHITKDGSIAGPRVLEHIVDTVLFLEGETHQPYRMLRAFKHRFGSTQEVGFFEMTGQGFKAVKNPSELFLQSRTLSPGSVAVPILEGQRPLLLEVQALVSRSWAGIPKRAATGIDFNRLEMMLAVLEKHGRLSLGQSDVYINVPGALKIKEPAADLAVALSIFSSAKEQSVPTEWIIFGEVGLGGEVRAVSFCEERLREAAYIGFKKAILPKANLKEKLKSRFLAGARNDMEGKDTAVELQGVETIAEAMDFMKHAIS